VLPELVEVLPELVEVLPELVEGSRCSCLRHFGMVRPFDKLRAPQAHQPLSAGKLRQRYHLFWKSPYKAKALNSS